MRNDPKVRSEIAKTFIRDEKGHFVKKPKVEQSPVSQQPLNPISQFLHDETQVHHTNSDALLDVHVGNPLKRIADLLEQIKKQKAFSFDIKGSLGLAGIMLTLGVFGIFGGTKALCSKGEQSKIGMLRILPFTEVIEQTWVQKLPLIGSYFPSKEVNRVLLIDNNKTTTHILPKRGISLTQFNNQEVVITGEYNSCSADLSLADQSHITTSY